MSIGVDGGCDEELRRSSIGRPERQGLEVLASGS